MPMKNLLRNCLRDASAFVRTLVRDPQFHEFLWWCVPALLVGLVLRAMLLVQMPYGFIQYDSADFLATPHQFLAHHHLVIHGKKSFLTPLFFLLPFLIHIPALIFIPLAQNGMGLIGVAVAGGLVRFWFKWWRWFIVPATVLTAANPFALWYEKTLMGEANFLFFTLLLALAATLWVRNPGRWSFGFMVLALFLNAGTRGEAKLFFALGIILVVFVLWRHWKEMLVHLAIVLLVMLGTFRISETSHAPSLLYGTLVHLTPDRLRFEPGVEPYVLPLRDRYRAMWVEHQSDLVKASKEINRAIDPYVTEKYGAENTKHKRTVQARVFQRLCLDVLIADPFGVFAIPFQKAQQAIDGWSSGMYYDGYLDGHQKRAAKRLKLPVLTKGLTGRAMSEEEMMTFIETHYDAKRLEWFGNYQKAWNTAMIFLRTPDRPMATKRWVHDYIVGVPGGLLINPGVPFFYILAFAGTVAAMLRPSQLGIFQIGWIATMLFVWWSATLVGVTNARFRFVYEPFCVIYILLLFDCLADWASRLFAARPAIPTVKSAVCI